MRSHRLVRPLFLLLAGLIGPVVGDGTAPLQAIPPAHTAAITAITYSSDGKLLATGSWDRIIRLWDLRRFKLLRSLHGHSSGVTKLAFTADSQTLASGSGDGDIKLWQVADGTQLHSMQHSPAYVTSVAIAPGGETVVSAQDRDTMLTIWDARAGVLQQTLPASGPAVFAPDGETVASAASWRVILWNVQTWSARLTLPAPKRVQE